MALFSRRASTERALIAVTGISDAERAWIDAHVTLVVDAGVNLSDAEDLRRCYERWSADWRRINPPERDDPSVMVNALGASLGEHLARRTTAVWGLAEEAGGVDLVLFRGRGEVVLRPLRLVESRWSAEEPSGEFLVTASSRVTSTLSADRRGRRARQGERAGRR